MRVYQRLSWCDAPSSEQIPSPRESGDYFHNAFFVKRSPPIADNMMRVADHIPGLEADRVYDNLSAKEFPNGGKKRKKIKKTVCALDSRLFPRHESSAPFRL